MHRAIIFAAFGSIIVVATANNSRPANESICDFYTTALFKDNTEQNQQRLITALVNTAVIGTYTNDALGTNISVPGILAKDAKYNGTAVNLVQYFDGALMSTNRGGKAGVAVNFLDDGGAAPLKEGKAANGTSSNQFNLLTHLYEYFGFLLNCSDYGTGSFVKYAGDTGMYDVHKFMALDTYEVSYFIEQVGLSAASFGVSSDDVVAVGVQLTNTFGHRCTPATALLPSEKPELQAICIEGNCPAGPDCSAYPSVVEPIKATATANSTASPTKTGAAGRIGVSGGIVAALSGFGFLMSML